jgi:hypothetical protein
MLKRGVTEFASLLCSLQVMLDFAIRLRVCHYKILDDFFATSQAVLESSTKEDSKLTRHSLDSKKEPSEETTADLGGGFSFFRWR